MPPTRSLPPAKAVKTERTHEENQERAYIAASRRSDRSLEARVESARRASEIHKRRTGRSLRVTEQDVQNEEMYEEEDDDLPLQYRRLTAHLQTGSADFNRRLSAYLTNHVAMRSALEQSISNSYAQQYPNVPQFANQQSMYPSPMLAHQGQQQMMQAPQSPSMYRQAPYPSPRPQQQVSQSTIHNRSASIATTPNSYSKSQNSPMIQTDRRMSMPNTQTSTGSPIDVRSPMSATPSSTPKYGPSFPQGSFSHQGSFPQNAFPLPSFDNGAFGNSDFSAFSTALPAETQGLLGSALDPQDPLTSMMMVGSNTLPGNYYDFNNQPMLPTTNFSKHQMHPSFDGLNSTLAPSALDLTQRNDSSQNQSFFENAFKDSTPAGTPDVNGESWGSWIDDSQWDMPSASQASQ